MTGWGPPPTPATEPALLSVRHTRRRSSFAVLLLSVALALTAAGPALGAAAPAGDVGQDVGFPQCGGSYPAAGAFGIVGVTHGSAFSANPCLATEWSWASARPGDASLVTTPANPAPTSSHYWPTSGSTDPVLCRDAGSTTDPGCAYDYGWHAAADALATATAVLPAGVATSVGWWLDVETTNTYNGDGTSNAADLQGMVDHLRGQGVPSVGFYSTSYQWTTITGGWTAANDAGYRAAWKSEFTPAFPMSAGRDWVAGAASSSDAQSTCGTSFSGGPTALAQYPDGGYDADVVCGSTPSAPSAVTGSPRNAAAAVSWTAPAAPGGTAVTGYTASASPGGASCTTAGATACTVTGLSNGTAYTFTVTATNGYGTGPSSASSSAVTPDGTAPAVGLAVLPAVSLGTLSAHYAGSDPGSGVASYDVRYRRALFNGGFGSPTYPSGWQGTTATTVTLAPSRGATYCFSARARDRAGNVSPWTAERCTTAPLDDRNLAASSGWSQGTSSVFYAATISRAASAGRTLTRTGVQAKRFWLVADTCSGCGSVQVLWNGRLLKTVSLNASATHYRVVLALGALTGVSSGTATVRSTGTARVDVDGLVVSRV